MSRNVWLLSAGAASRVRFFGGGELQGAVPDAGDAVIARAVFRGLAARLMLLPARAIFVLCRRPFYPVQDDTLVIR